MLNEIGGGYPLLFRKEGALMDLGARIKELRNERKLSQEAVAAALQVSRQAVAKWEANAASPSTANLMALCQLFQVSLTSLTQPPTPQPFYPPALHRGWRERSSPVAGGVVCRGRSVVGRRFFCLVGFP